MNSFSKQLKKWSTISKDEIAKMLSTDKDMLERFEKAYQYHAMDDCDHTVFFGSPKPVSDKGNNDIPKEIIERIAENLAAQTPVFKYTKTDGASAPDYLPDGTLTSVSAKEANAFPEEIRPQLTDCAMKKDTAGASYEAVLSMLYESLHEKNTMKKKQYYHLFRQGLDILDLDPVLYEMLGTNPNSMGHWLPALIPAVDQQGFFHIPDTTIIKVPMPVLQLTRLGYETLTPATLQIVNLFCKKVFGLESDGDYFVKTGTFSSKFDFRNARVYGEKEVEDLGEYLLYLNSQAVEMAGPLFKPSVYGASTTNEWVVRKFIKDHTGRPTIYKGLPLRTEYRLFVDFDSESILGSSIYWEPQKMKAAFSRDEKNPHDFHDYITYESCREEMEAEYRSHIDAIKERLSDILPYIPLTGQWSLDILQDGKDFWIIDMALASTSALSECIPDRLLIDDGSDANWILPDLSLTRCAGFAKHQIAP